MGSFIDIFDYQKAPHFGVDILQIVPPLAASISLCRTYNLMQEEVWDCTQNCRLAIFFQCVCSIRVLSWPRSSLSLIYIHSRALCSWASLAYILRIRLHPLMYFSSLVPFTTFFSSQRFHEGCSPPVGAWPSKLEALWMMRVPWRVLPQSARWGVSDRWMAPKVAIFF